MVAGTVDVSGGTPHIRPFSPARDLADLATLIEAAFGPELSLMGNTVVRDMRRMAMLGPLLHLSPLVMPFFSGYVWVQDGRVVGNTSINLVRSARGTWSISNVAVLPEYRGQGIASHLLDTAMTHVRRCRGTRVLLQVRTDNEVARGLYERRGFARYETIHEIELAAHNWPIVIGAPMAATRGVRARDQRSLHDLVVACTPREVLLREPVLAASFRRGLGWLLKQSVQMAFSGEQYYERVAEVDGRLVAYGRMIANLMQGPYDLALYVHPEQRGRWESALADVLFWAVDSIPHRRVRSRISGTHPEAREALECLGFRTLRVLDQMSCDVG